MQSVYLRGCVYFMIQRRKCDYWVMVPVLEPPDVSDGSAEARVLNETQLGQRLWGRGRVCRSCGCLGGLGMLVLGGFSCSELGKVGLVGGRGVLLGLGTSELGPWNGYVLGRAWPTGLGTLPLRKPAVSLESPLKGFFFLFKVFRVSI